MQPPPAPGRRLAPDLARGFMLLFIALANVSWYLYGHPPGPIGPHPAPAGVVDSVIQVLMLTIVDGRAFPMFAFLFAYGMVQFYTSRRARGVPDPAVRAMLNRRHLTMLVIGFLHALLLFVGDVVGAYALAGLLVGALFFFRRTAILKTWTIVMGALMVLVGVLVAVLGVWLQTSGTGTVGTDTSTSDLVDLTAGEADYLVAALWRVSTWAGNALAAGLVIPIPLLLFVGWMAGRVQLLENVARHRVRLVRVAAVTIPVGWALGLVTGLQQVGVLTFEHAPWMLVVLNSVAGMGTGIGYACVFALLGARHEQRPPRAVLAVAAVGQRSLSSYLWQSLLLAPLLSAWGFALGDDIGTWQAMALAAGVWASSVVLCDLLARRGRRGPVEVVLRSITYGRGARPTRPGPPPAPQLRPVFRPPPGPGSA